MLKSLLLVSLKRACLAARRAKRVFAPESAPRHLAQSVAVPAVEMVEAVIVIAVAEIDLIARSRLAKETAKAEKPSQR
jgi:hypothetical protein